MLDQHKIEGMSLEDFMTKYEEQPFELIDGKMIDMTPMKYKHNVIQKWLFLKFVDYESSGKNGEVFSEMPFVLEHGSDWVKGSRVPDVMYYCEEKPMILTPDSVIEIISPTDKYSEVNRKAEVYLEDGVNIIRVVDPERQTVAEYTQAKPDPITNRKDDVLSGGNVAKGLS